MGVGAGRSSLCDDRSGWCGSGCDGELKRGDQHAVLPFRDGASRIGARGRKPSPGTHWPEAGVLEVRARANTGSTL